MPNGMEMIRAERVRQQQKEGFDRNHDKEHKARELARAAFCYWGFGTALSEEDVRALWPWEWKWWKPKGMLENFVRAGALYMAQAERDDDRNYMTEVNMLANRIDRLLAEGIPKCKSTKYNSACLRKALDDEPIFVLRAKDESAPYMVRQWAESNQSKQPPEKILSAYTIAHEMEQYRKLHFNK